MVSESSVDRVGRPGPRSIREQQAKQENRRHDLDPRWAGLPGRLPQKGTTLGTEVHTGASCSGGGGWAVDSGVEAHGQRAGRPGWGRGGLVTAGPDRVSRGQLTEGQGPGRLPGNQSVRSAGGESRERARGVPRDGRPGEGWMSTTGRRRRTAARGACGAAPLPGPVDELPAWRCLAGREGGRPNAGKGVALQGGAS